MTADHPTASFESQRSHLRRVAYGLLGSRVDADAAVEETWLRLGRAVASGAGGSGGRLTTVLARICLDKLRVRRSRPEPPGDPIGSAGAIPGDAPQPLDAALRGDEVGSALLGVLDTLAPAERIAFVLHDLFGSAFEDVADVLGRTPVAARQLASHARRRIQSTTPPVDLDRTEHRHIVAAFLTASRDGRTDALIALLDDRVELRADEPAAAAGAPATLAGAALVAETFKGRARATELAIVDGEPAAVWAPGGRLRVVFAFTIAGGKIRAIDVLADPLVLNQLEVALQGE